MLHDHGFIYVLIIHTQSLHVILCSTRMWTWVDQEITSNITVWFFHFFLSRSSPRVCICDSRVCEYGWTRKLYKIWQCDFHFFPLEIFFFASSVLMTPGTWYWHPSLCDYYNVLLCNLVIIPYTNKVDFVCMLSRFLYYGQWPWYDMLKESTITSTQV